MVRRCTEAAWACGGECGAGLGCRHSCPAPCHPPPCPPCPKVSVQSCACGRQKEPRACSAPGYKCGTPCGKLLGCQHHQCDIICHAGLASNC